MKRRPWCDQSPTWGDSFGFKTSPLKNLISPKTEQLKSQHPLLRSSPTRNLEVHKPHPRLTNHRLGVPAGTAPHVLNDKLA